MHFQSSITGRGDPRWSIPIAVGSEHRLPVQSPPKMVGRHNSQVKGLSEAARSYSLNILKWFGISAEGKCFKYNQAKKPWSQLHLQCNSLGGSRSRSRTPVDDAPLTPKVCFLSGSISELGNPDPTLKISAFARLIGWSLMILIAISGVVIESVTLNFAAMSFTPCRQIGSDNRQAKGGRSRRSVGDCGTDEVSWRT